jgi:hypothetical protein
MSLRRFVGCAVMVLLVASVALPAICGSCMDLAAKPSCGERHDAGTSRNRRLAMAMGGHCADCGEQPGITARETELRALVSEVMFFDCARRLCVQAGEQNAIIYRGGFDAYSLVGDRAIFGVCAEIASPGLGTIRLHSLGSGKASGNFAYPPLLVSLKI